MITSTCALNTTCSLGITDCSGKTLNLKELTYGKGIRRLHGVKNLKKFRVFVMQTFNTSETSNGISVLQVVPFWKSNNKFFVSNAYVKKSKLVLAHFWYITQPINFHQQFFLFHRCLSQSWFEIEEQQKFKLSPGILFCYWKNLHG